jgi:hypothetical protein
MRFALWRPGLVAWVDLPTGVEHLLTPAAAAADQGTHGRHIAVCGAEVLPANSTESERDCQSCHRLMPTQRSRTSRSRTTLPPAPQRARLTGMVDAETSVEHLITDESAVAHRHAGRYLAVCGAQVLAASLTAPQRSRCPVCTRGAR